MSGEPGVDARQHPVPPHRGAAGLINRDRRVTYRSYDRTGPQVSVRVRSTRCGLGPPPFDRHLAAANCFPTLGGLGGLVATKSIKIGVAI